MSDKNFQTDLKEATREGFQAQRLGFERSSCPFHSPNLQEAWCSGWDHAKELEDAREIAPTHPSSSKG